MNTGFLRKLENNVISPIFISLMLLWLFAPKGSLWNDITSWGATIFFIVDLFLYILIYLFKDKNEPLIIKGKGKIVYVYYAFIVGILMALLAYMHNGNTLLMILESIASALCIIFAVWVFCNREKLRQKGTLE
ncbi:MAG: hypothetical protein LUE26_00740 [Alistipes sp.]|nr:hypothetical protein [Alistipes sp.]